jgi:hypothetical protein
LTATDIFLPRYEMSLYRNGDVVFTADLSARDGPGPSGVVRSVERIRRGLVDILRLVFDRGVLLFPDVSADMAALVRSARTVTVHWYCHADRQHRGQEVPRLCRAGL